MLTFGVIGQLPLFFVDTCIITLNLEFREQDGTVYYLLSGIAIFSHDRCDLLEFQYITSNHILKGLCSNQDIVDAFHVSTENVRLWKRVLSCQGEAAPQKPLKKIPANPKIIGHFLILNISFPFPKYCRFNQLFNVKFTKPANA